MQIQVKQPEIIEAIKMYLADRGLSLAGKNVTAVFSMTRKPSQVTAEVTIDSTDIPGYGEHDAGAPNLPAALTPKVPANPRAQIALEESEGKGTSDQPGNAERDDFSGEKQEEITSVGQAGQPSIDPADAPDQGADASQGGDTAADPKDTPAAPADDVDTETAGGSGGAAATSGKKTTSLFGG